MYQNPIPEWVGTSLAGVVILAIVFLVVLAILWIALPFAVFGTKDHLKQICTELKSANEILLALRKDLTSVGSHNPKAPKTESVLTEGLAARLALYDKKLSPPKD